MNEAEARRQQRELTMAYDASVAGRLKQSGLPHSVVLRMLSAERKHASAWLCPLPGAHEPLWLDAAQFIALVRRRRRLCRSHRRGVG